MMQRKDGGRKELSPKLSAKKVSSNHKKFFLLENSFKGQHKI